jgi:hypothetical protein
MATKQITLNEQIFLLSTAAASCQSIIFFGVMMILSNFYAYITFSP